MLVQDLKNCCMEQNIELRCIDEKRGKWLKNNEAVRLFAANGYVLVESLTEEGKIIKTSPVDAHTISVLDKIMDVSEQCLVENIEDSKHILHLLVKQYPEVRNFDCSVRVTDQFLRKGLAKQIEIKNPMNIIGEIMAQTMYCPNEVNSYYVIGINVDLANENDAYNEFIIAACDYYIHVSKRTNENDLEYFEADKVTRMVNKKKYKFILVTGKIVFTDEKEEIKEQVKQALGPLSDDMYIKIWNRYGELEEKIILDRMRNMGAAHFVSYEPELGLTVRFDLSARGEEKLNIFKEYVKKGDMLSILPLNPFSRQMENVELRNFFESKDVKGAIINGRLEEDINVNSGRLMIAVDEENYERLRLISEGYIFLSIMGDKQRLDRRENARRQIETMACPMPELTAILEGKRGSIPKKKNIQALSPILLEESKYQNLTAKQIEAIKIALNTPDIAIIQGPPGTGKTTVITAIIKRLEEEADLTGGLFGRSLITAFQHDAVENATERLRILGLPAIKFGKKYSDIESDESDINKSVQRWIGEKLEELNQKHSNIHEVEYMTQFYKLYSNYQLSAVSMHQTVGILESIRDCIGNRLSLSLLERLNEQINELKFYLYDPEDECSDILIKAIRRIPTNIIAYEDNGYGVIKNAIVRLERQRDNYLRPFIAKLKDMVNEEENLDFEELTLVKNKILIHILPKMKVFTSNGKKSTINNLLSDIAEELHKKMEESKQGEDLILLEYMQSIEENPMAVKQAILDYSVVNGATNQQVMRKEIRDLKGGDIVYDNVLVDEAARSNPLDLFIPMSVAKDRIILVGDHRQLPHIVDEEIVNELENNVENLSFKGVIEQRIKESMFEQLFNRLRKLEEKDNIKRIITLDKQFRMHPTLGTFINRNFYSKYGENVDNGLPDAKKFCHSLGDLKNKACVWLNVPIEMGREREAQSKSRRVEADYIAKHIKSLLDLPDGKKYTYGIITFYREQVNIINEALADEKQAGVFVKDETDKYSISPNYWNDAYGTKDYIKVGTVDAFQGMEFDVVYLSMVRSNNKDVMDVTWDENNMSVEDEKRRKKRESELRKKYGFLMIENRLCVAMSRAKKMLICVGDSGMLNHSTSKEAIPSLVDYYKVCEEDEYGTVI